MITVEAPRELHILDQIALSDRGSLWFYDHSGMKTPFSRWLAINRQRRSVKFRHTTKDIDRVVFSTSDIATAPGLVAFDDGQPKNYLSFFRVDTNGLVASLQFKDVQTLKPNNYFLWRRE